MKGQANSRGEYAEATLPWMPGLLAVAPIFAEPSGTNPPGKHVEKVLGIGGLFFRAQNPKSLGKWYQDNLGVNPVPDNYDQSPWKQEAGPTVFAPFPIDSKHFGNPGKAWMVNFRVRNLDAMAAQLRASGIEVKIDPQQRGRVAGGASRSPAAR